MKMCGPFFWSAALGFWWVFPLIGLLMCFAIALFFGRMGGGCMGMSRHHATPNNHAPEV
jgi:hypothetical protein